ncbi:hypothetical protein WJX73_003218 [Symbiochloris irregularis]|uniref:Uncharacterized protein n=1 Tax=Symbiochloris irregularis TaxID=706552 RepID=A0AAW1PWD3_9CHLO
MQRSLVDHGLPGVQPGGRALSSSHRCLASFTHPARRACPSSPLHRRAAPSRSSVSVMAAGVPPPVSDTKSKFYTSYRKPLNAIYNTVIQELLVQQHIIRYNTKYQYDEVYALGFVSIFDQIIEGVPVDKDAVFAAYIEALTEDPKRYREDAEKLEKWASGISSPEDLTPAADSDDEVRKSLAAIAARAEDGSKFLYSRFFAVGLFRLLELSKAKDPQALQGLVKAMHVPQESVNRDLTTYKGLLSKLNAAKELMREYTARERKKAEERAAAKAEAAKGKDEGKDDKKEAEGQGAEKKEPVKA